MGWLQALLTDSGSFTHALLAYSLIIAAGLWIGRFRFFGVSVGVTCVLFLGLFARYLGVDVDPSIISFFRNFGLVLFVFFIGLQVGPSFFSTLRNSGWGLNGLMCLSVGVSLLLTVGIWAASDGALALPQLLGVHFGAVTSTPGLGATQEALAAMGYKGDITVGYACAYPVSIIGVILTLLFVRKVFGIDVKHEEMLWEEAQKKRAQTPIYFHVTLSNHALDNHTLREIRSLVGRNFICSRILHDGVITSPTADTVVHEGDKLRIVAGPRDKEAIVAFCGEEDTKIDLATAHSPLVSRLISVTREEVNGALIEDLHLSRMDGVNITRVNRSGVVLFPYNTLRLQIGDTLNCVGPANAVARLAAMMGNQEKRLERPNVFAIFIGIALGLVLGSVPIAFPGMPTEIKLGLAGGPLIAAILLSYYGPRFHLVVHDRLRQPDAQGVGPHVLPRKHGPGRRRHVHRGLRERHRLGLHGARPRDQRRAHGRHGRRRAPLHAAQLPYDRGPHRRRLDEQLGAQLRQQPLRTRPRRARLLDRLPARDVPAHHLGPDHPDALLLHAVNEELTEVRRAFPEVGANDVFGKVERSELKRSTELGEV